MLNLEKNEVFIVSGEKDEDAMIAMNVVSDDVTIILSNNRGNKIFKPKTGFQKVGKFETQVKFTFLFYERPWKTELGFPNQNYYTTSSTGRGLEDRILLTPDILEIGIHFKTKVNDHA